MNYVYCNDLKNHQVLGTFLELLYHLKVVKKENPIPMVIVGARDAKKTPYLKSFLSEKLDIKDGIYQINNETSLNNTIGREAASLTDNIASIEELQSLKYNGINIGIGIASSLISKHRCTTPNLIKTDKELLLYTQQAILFLESFQKTISRNVHADDTIYIYNGRHYNTYPQSLFCEQIGCNILYYERMNSWKNLKIQKPRIHNFLAISNIVKTFWENANDTEKEKIGESYFDKNRSNKFTRNFSEKLEIDKELISFFTSSEDEYASLDPRIRISDVFDSQRMGFEWLANWAASQKKYELVVRLHPNQELTCPTDYNYWHKYSCKNVTIIPSDSNIDSYDLITRSSKVISFLSTIGIEATRFGVPSITIGNPIYKGLDAVYEPTSREQLTYLLENNIKPKNKENTTPYGYYNLSYGSKLEFLSHTGLAYFKDYPSLLSGNKV